MKRWMHFLPAACILALTACGSAPAQNEPAETAAQTTAAQTTDTAAAVTTTVSETAKTTVSVSETTAASSATTAAASASTVQTTASTAAQTVTVSYAEAPFTPAYTVTEPPEQKEQGGNGGEEHAQDIDPLYFNYLFGDDEAALRLAGGTYQVIAYDFSEALQNDVASKYYLEDADYDGDLDLCVPVHFSATNTEYAVFLWDRDSMHYAETPVMLMNPVFKKEQKQILCAEHISAAKSVLTFYGWENGKLKTLKSAAADYTMLTFVYTGADGKKEIHKPESKDELTKLIDDFLA